MRLRPALATTAWLGVLGLASPARAQHFEGRASVTMTGAYTETVGSQTPGGGPLFAVSPAFIALIDTPRTTSTLTYTFALSVLPSTGQASTSVGYANHFTYGGHYELDEITSATLGASFSESPINSVDVSQSPTAAPVQAVPTSAAYMVTAGASEGLSRALTETTGIGQAFSFGLGSPLDTTDPNVVPAKSFTFSNNLSLTRSFWKGNLSISVGNQTNLFTSSTALGSTTSGTSTYVSTPGSRAYVNSLLAGWVHPFTESLAGSISLGVSEAIQPSNGGYLPVQPAANASLTYTYRLATAALSYAHQSSPNLATASLSNVDAASLRLSVPIGVSGFATVGTVGFTHTTPANGQSTTQTTTQAVGVATGPTNVFLVDAGFSYTPPSVQTLTAGVRAILSRQQADFDDGSADTADTFTRYTIGVSLTYSYPNVRAAQVRPSFDSSQGTQAPTPADVVSSDRFNFGPVEEARPAPAPSP